MKTVPIEQTTLDACVSVAQNERVVITRGGSPIAIMVGLEGLDEEQVQLGASDKFWRLMAERRKEKGLSREALEQRVDAINPADP